jgi:hypothetical protein
LRSADRVVDIGAGDEHGPEDVGTVEQLHGGAGEAELALLHEHGPFGQVQGHVDRLFHDDDGEARGVDLMDDVDQLADDGGGQAERQLVDEQQLGVVEQGHGQGHPPNPVASWGAVPRVESDGRARRGTARWMYSELNISFLTATTYLFIIIDCSIRKVWTPMDAMRSVQILGVRWHLILLSTRMPLQVGEYWEWAKQPNHECDCH